MPPEGSTRYGSDTQGQFFVFDMENFETWLTFLLGNMYVGFGGDLYVQAIGTNCASNHANFLNRISYSFSQKACRLALTFKAIWC